MKKYKNPGDENYIYIIYTYKMVNQYIYIYEHQTKKATAYI